MCGSGLSFAAWLASFNMGRRLCIPCHEDELKQAPVKLSTCKKVMAAAGFVFSALGMRETVNALADCSAKDDRSEISI